MLLEVWPVFSFLKAQKQTAAVSDDVMDKGVSALDLGADRTRAEERDFCSLCLMKT